MDGDLSAKADRLDESVQSLERATRDLVERTGRNRRAIRVAFAGLAVDLVLTVLGVVTVVHVIEQGRAQNEDRDQLCALYGLILDSDTPQRRASMEGEELDRYEQAIDVITEGAVTLDCER